MTSEPLADAQDMFAVHTMLRREWTLVPGLVLGVAAGDEARTTLVANHVDFMATALGVHHSDEDKHVWPPLRARGGEKVASIVDLMECEHTAIHQGLMRVVDAVGPWRESASARTRDALAHDVADLLPVLEKHLADEEARAVPLIEEYVTAAEYARCVPEAVVAIGQARLPVFFGMILYEASPAVIDLIVSQMPSGFREATAKAYAAYAQKLYGTATPPRETGRRLDARQGRDERPVRLTVSPAPAGRPGDLRSPSKAPPQMGSGKTIERLIEGCRSVVAAGEGQAAIRELVAAAVSDPAAIVSALGDPQHAGVGTLYRSRDLTIIQFTWAPWMCFKPHNHCMWAVIGIFAGREDNVFWRRTEDRIEAAGAKSLGVRDVTTLSADVIHSVTNPVGKMTRAIHVYGGDFFSPPRPRSAWDPETLAERPYDVDETVRLFTEAEARARVQVTSR